MAIIKTYIHEPAPSKKFDESSVVFLLRGMTPKLSKEAEDVASVEWQEFAYVATNGTRSYYTALEFKESTLISTTVDSLNGKTVYMVETGKGLFRCENHWGNPLYLGRMYVEKSSRGIDFNGDEAYKGVIGREFSLSR